MQHSFGRVRQLLIGGIVLGVAAGLFFMYTTPRVPLAIGVAGVTNRQPVGLAIQILVTNRTTRPLRFEASALALSAGTWCDDYRCGEGIVEAQDFTGHLVQTHETPAVVRFRFGYWKIKTRREVWFDAIRKKIGLPTPRPDWEGEIFVTEPFKLSGG
jgi:hypothetical protein